MKLRWLLFLGGALISAFTILQGIGGHVHAHGLARRQQVVAVAGAAADVEHG